MPWNPSTGQMGVSLGLTTRQSGLIGELQAKERWAMFLRMILHTNGHPYESAPTHMCTCVHKQREREREGERREEEGGVGICMSRQH